MQPDPVIEKLKEHDQKLAEISQDLVRIKETIATKDQVEELVTLVGNFLGTIDRLDDERTVHAESIRRLHDRDETQQVDIDRVKTHVGIQ